MFTQLICVIIIISSSNYWRHELQPALPQHQSRPFSLDVTFYAVASWYAYESDDHIRHNPTVADPNELFLCVDSN